MVIELESEYEFCKTLIKNIKKFLDRKDYTGLKLYIDKEENYVENCRILSKSAEEEYLDSLVKDLDIPNG